MTYIELAQAQCGRRVSDKNDSQAAQTPIGTTTMRTRDLFHSRWIVANAMAEGIGLGGTLLIAHLVIGSFDAARPGTAGILLGALLAVAMGTVLEGALAGRAQARVLAQRTLRVAAGTWSTMLCIARPWHAIADRRVGF